jgi:mRNA-degrading endonuclease RelE of RelBE toxin-antitoxin system
MRATRCLALFRDRRKRKPNVRPRPARRGDFRVIYEVDDVANVVVIHRAVHRKAAYGRR